MGKRFLRGIKTVSQLLSQDDVSICLEQADQYKSNLQAVLIIGLDNDGELYLSGSQVDSGDALIMLEKAKIKIINDSH